MTIDPCTPKGYLYERESPKLSPSSLGEKNRYLSALQSGGNFSECRSAANMMLQKGKGYTVLHCTDIFVFNRFYFCFVLTLIISLLGTREMFLSTLQYRVNFHAKASGDVSGYRKFLPHFQGFIISMIQHHQLIVLIC